MSTNIFSQNNLRCAMSEFGANARWLNAHEDRSAGVHTFSGRCVALCDAAGTGDHCLVVAEPKFTPTTTTTPATTSESQNHATKNLVTGRLRVYRGAATLCSDRPLHGAPSALVAFYTDELEPRVPAVAVSVGADILLYKNSKPFFKFTVPSLPTTALEQDVWNHFSHDYEPSALSSQLELLRSVPFKDLSPRSHRLLTLASSYKENDTNKVLEDFIGRYTHAEIPSRLSVITCMTYLNKNSLNLNAVACLVVATEAGHVYFLDPHGFSILHQASATNSTESPGPALIACSGMFDVEFRCIICLRDGSFYVLRRGWLEGTKLLQVPAESIVVEMVIKQPEQHIILGLTDGTILSYTKRGKKLWSISTGNQTKVTCLSLIPLPHLNTCLIAAGLHNLNNTGSGVLQLYQGRVLVDTLQLPDTPSAVKFGRLGQEENILVIITRDGSLLFKILKRIADFNAIASQQENANSTTLLSKPLPLPKRSKLFAEQAQRERLNANRMHQTFQQDLILLRLRAGRATIQALGTTDHNISENIQHPVKLAAQVLGLGPKFTLTLILENLSNEVAVTDLSVVLHTQISKYKIGKPYITIPLIPPELEYKIETSVIEILSVNDAVDINANSDFSATTPIRVFVITSGQVQPVLAATINMPTTDPLAFMV